jgi:hypothetical protein
MASKAQSRADSFTEEFSARSEFVQEHGEFLPDDLCPDIGDLPPDINHLLVR